MDNATKISIQHLAARKAEAVMSKLIDTTDMPIADILHCQELEKVSLKAADEATKEIGITQTVVVVIALTGIAKGEEEYTPMAACVDAALKNATLAGLYNRKKVLEAQAFRKN